MLEQHRAQQKGYITLREAAIMAGYTPDYMGQLIRAGKLKGEQVYSSVVWMTTPEEINAYLHERGKTLIDNEVINNNSLNLGFVESYWLKFGLYGIITVFVIVLLFLQFVFYSLLATNTPFDKTNTSETEVEIVVPVNSALVYD